MSEFFLLSFTCHILMIIIQMSSRGERSYLSALQDLWVCELASLSCIGSNFSEIGMSEIFTFFTVCPCIYSYVCVRLCCIINQSINQSLLMCHVHSITLGQTVL